MRRYKEGVRRYEEGVRKYEEEAMRYKDGMRRAPPYHLEIVKMISHQHKNYYFDFIKLKKFEVK